MLRPGGRRRRRRPSAIRRLARWLPLAIVVAVALGLLIGSLAEVSARSAPYHRTTDTSYAALATPVVRASNQTGAALATLLADAPGLQDGGLPFTARAVLQQGLDDAVTTSASAAARAHDIATPGTSGSVASQFTSVMQARADATYTLRSAIDRLLDMAPLPVAGSTTGGDGVPSGTPLSVAAATPFMAHAGTSLQQADDDYRALLADIRQHGYPIHLPASVWVTDPVSVAPLGSVALGALTPVLAATPTLTPTHQLAWTAVGFEPPAVPPSPAAPPSAPGTLGMSCTITSSNVAAPAPTILPPTTSLTVKGSATNCGNAAESGALATATVTLSDPPGTAAPTGRPGGGSSRTTITLRSGGSTALAFGSFPVAKGHRYLVALSVSLPAGEAGVTAGSSQQLLVQITG